MIEPYQAIGLVPTMRGPEADASPSRAVAELSGCRDRILLIYCMGVLCAVALAGIWVLRLRAVRESATLWCHD
jgi:hypothetical protein